MDPVMPFGLNQKMQSLGTLATKSLHRHSIVTIWFGTVVLYIMDEYAVGLSFYLREHVWTKGFAILQDAACACPSLPFVQPCTDLLYVRRNIHSFEELRTAVLQQPYFKWVNTFAPHVFHISRVMHAHSCLILAHPRISGLQSSISERWLLASARMVQRTPHLHPKVP